MKAIGRKVVIRPKEVEDTTSSGIIKVTDTSNKYAQGVVVTVGRDVSDVKEDDTIIYSPLTYDEIMDGGETLHVVDEDDIFAIIDE